MLTPNLSQYGIRTHFNMPKFIGSMDAGKQHSGSQGAVGLNCNGIFELQHSAHGISGYYDSYWWKIYPWVSSSSFETKILRKTDNTWVMIDANNSTIRYTNPAVSTTPPQTGWVNAGGGTPVPKLGFRTLITEQNLLSVTNCSEGSRTSNSISIVSSSSSAHKIFTFGNNTLSDGDNFAFGYKLDTILMGASDSFTIAFGGITPVMTGSTGSANTAQKKHSFDQTVGSNSTGSTSSSNTGGLSFTTSGTSQFPDNATLILTDLRVMAL
tara:strand:+ start:317 stop:1120 length:804 start_codon:yes stop_codon:yes gene_type:complete